MCADFKAKGTKRPAIAAENRERVGKAGNSAKRPQQTKNNDLCIRLCVCLFMFVSVRACVCERTRCVCSQKVGNAFCRVDNAIFAVIAV